MLVTSKYIFVQSHSVVINRSSGGSDGLTIGQSVSRTVGRSDVRMFGRSEGLSVGRTVGRTVGQSYIYKQINI